MRVYDRQKRIGEIIEEIFFTGQQQTHEYIYLGKLDEAKENIDSLGEKLPKWKPQISDRRFSDLKKKYFDLKKEYVKKEQDLQKEQNAVSKND
ncbi:MAG: hypothetical protein KKB65_00940 [Nanoarchaeota archaeon]|nr:hypothetical protein [Nanoarchaeota archaeon]MBU1849605.1 hypothetical protein [Nanoarchaeota archaeon]